MSDWREALLQTLNHGAPSEAEIFTRLSDAAARYGYEFCSFGVRLPDPGGDTNEVWCTNYPDAWQAHYMANDYLHHDPVIHQARGSHLPVVWNAATKAGQAAFWGEASEHGIRHGWTLALYGANGAFGLISLARSHDRIDEAELADNEARLLWLSHAALEAVSARHQRRQPTHASHALSERERDILRWALAGKTAEETACILAISSRTVHFHMMEIMQKLNVVNKTQAVAKALVLNLID
ncbi:MAG TPA: LuxR family transcriptional regulator [Rhodanobacteraceae bacterium]|nr:LuxR family transcriptional regulator [Rhodanobacteraceae bacterium]